jgi:hypothetical protein
MDITRLKPVKLADAQRGYQVGDNAKSVLVRRDSESFEWSVVDRLENSLDSAQLQNAYGVWTDQKSGGVLGLFKSYDGAIQENEVSTKPFESKERVQRDTRPGEAYEVHRHEVSQTRLNVPENMPMAPSLETEWILQSTQSVAKPGYFGGGCG